MKYPIIEIGLNLSTVGDYLFSQCRFVFQSVNVGDYEQIVLAKNLLLSLEDLEARLDNVCVEECFAEEINDRLDLVIKHDIRNCCLPLGIESFDGDKAAFFKLLGEHHIAIRPWGSSLFIEKLDPLQYRDTINNNISCLRERITANKGGREAARE